MEVTGNVMTYCEAETGKILWCYYDSTTRALLGERALSLVILSLSPLLLSRLESLRFWEVV